MEHPENNAEYKGLAVNKGIEQPSSVNPYLKRKPKKRQLSVAEFVEGIVKGDITVLSRAVTLVESVKPEHQAVAQEVIEKCLPYSGDSVRIVSAACPCGKEYVNRRVRAACAGEWGKVGGIAMRPKQRARKGVIWRQDPYGAAFRTSEVVYPSQPFGRFVRWGGAQDAGDDCALRGCRIR